MSCDRLRRKLGRTGINILTRFDDGTVTTDSSLVRICPGFIPPPGIDDDGDGVGKGTDVCEFIPLGAVVDSGTGCSIVTSSARVQARGGGNAL